MTLLGQVSSFFFRCVLSVVADRPLRCVYGLPAANQRHTKCKTEYQNSVNSPQPTITTEPGPVVSQLDKIYTDDYIVHRANEIFLQIPVAAKVFDHDVVDTAGRYFLV